MVHPGRTPCRERMSTDPLDREDLRQRVQKALDGFVAGQLPVLDGISEELGPLTDALSDLVAGGKRLRPAFCYWGFRGAGGQDGEQVVAAAAALELFQACALIHDDVMDGSDTRRGRPAVHKRFAAMHGEQFGNGAAILLGDLCLSWSDEMLVSSGIVDDASRRVFDTMRAELMAGQYLDLLKQVSDPTRLQVLMLLSEKERNVSELCADLGTQSQPAVSHHLALLRHGRLIEPRRAGKHNFYGLTDGGRELAQVVKTIIA